MDITKKVEYLKYRRNVEEISPITVNGATFDFDETAQMRFLLARDFMERHDATISWTTTDNGSVVISSNDIDAIIDAAAIRSNEAHIKYRVLYNRVQEATTQAELDEIEW